MAQLPIFDSHLEELVCSQCKKYLSVFPVKVYENNVVKCGRCCTYEQDEGVVSLFEELAKHCLFKCNNRYEGCRKLLLPSEVVEHEKTCIGNSYSCPSCEFEENPLMSPDQLIQHFKLRHSKYFLTSNTFCLTLATKILKKKLFYIQDDNIFIVLLKYIPNDKDLYICVATLYELKNAEHQFVMSANAIHFKQKTKRQQCAFLGAFTNEQYCKIDVSDILFHAIKFEIILDMSKTSVYTYAISSNQFDGNNSAIVTKQSVPEVQSCRVKLTSEFHRFYRNFRLTHCETALYSINENKLSKFTCDNCREILTYSCYVCTTQTHLVCIDCNAWCRLCDKPINKISTEVVPETKYLLFSCKWKCGTQCFIKNIRDHEKYCYMNKRKCPLCSSVLNIQCLRSHLLDKHQFGFIEDISNLDVVLPALKSNVEYYFILNNSMFKIRCERRYNLYIAHSDDMPGLKLYVITETNGCSLYSNQFYVHLSQKPKLYLSSH